MRIVILVLLLLCFILWARARSRYQVFYIENALPPAVFDAICKQVKHLYPTDFDDDYAVGRKIAFVPHTHPIVNMIYNAHFMGIVKEKTHCNVTPCFEHPIEYRVYQQGSHMDWHKDDLLYAKPQLECVLTLENDSDSLTQYHTTYGTKSIHTKPNSLLIVFGDGALHRVTPLNRGHRSIMKFVLMQS